MSWVIWRCVNEEYGAKASGSTFEQPEPDFDEE
jgi:hypothetical protein